MKVILIAAALASLTLSSVNSAPLSDQSRLCFRRAPVVVQADVSHERTRLLANGHHRPE
jgi:hypothetical protein